MEDSPDRASATVNLQDGVPIAGNCPGLPTHRTTHVFSVSVRPIPAWGGTSDTMTNGNGEV